jgi:hypothetical protein
MEPEPQTEREQGDRTCGPPPAPERNGGVMTPRRAHTTRELAAREGDGICVRLLWHPGDDALTVSVEDARVGDNLEIAVEPGRALDAFYHPFAYAA